MNFMASSPLNADNNPPWSEVMMFKKLFQTTNIGDMPNKELITAIICNVQCHLDCIHQQRNKKLMRYHLLTATLSQQLQSRMVSALVIL